MTTQLDFGEYFGTFLETLHRLKKRGVPLETCKFYFETFVKTIKAQNPDLVDSVSGIPLVYPISNNEFLAAGLDGNPILIQVPQHSFNRFSSTEHYEKK